MNSFENSLTEIKYTVISLLCTNVHVAITIYDIKGPKVSISKI